MYVAGVDQLNANEFDVFVDGVATSDCGSEGAPDVFSFIAAVTGEELTLPAWSHVRK
jgi:hypothetical protein